jgi:hypothetical protein
MPNNDNRDFNNREDRRAYIRECTLELERKDKAASPLASLTDRGVDLTPEEERDVRAYGEKMGVGFDEIAQELAATYTVIGERSNTKLYASLAKRNVLPRNLLALLMKNRMHMQAMARI